jgi:hypothetical protein
MRWLALVVLSLEGPIVPLECDIGFSLATFCVPSIKNQNTNEGALRFYDVQIRN